ncbi:helix-turn-helix transcriptional regulator [uncultured Winogradskyella sp.]|uniref:helix-turn-helix domain-containing protein n=1 Tax=uncultured Winogradskyella sp. TaxID=395353 RepID=UPI00261DB0EE|nr:helix-turn-helix transcriptional regulator [uncultured Winogradskyella sp.]
MHFIPDVSLITLTEMYKYVYIPLAALFPPFYYFYVINFLYPNHKTTIKEKLLFLPFVVFLILNIAWRIGILINYEKESFYTFFGNVLNFIEIFSNVFTIVMLIYLLKKSFDYEKQHKSFNINTIYNRINWLKITLFILLTISFLWSYLVYKNLAYGISFYSLWICMSAVIYWLGYLGIYKFGIIEDRKNIRLHHNSHITSSKENITKNKHIIALEQLLNVDNIYLDPNLTLDSVSNALNVSSGHLSRIIKTELNTNFNDYINSYRVNQAKAYLKNPEFSKYTITAIGLEAGFNSKSAFYSAFKKATDKTPSAFKKMTLNQVKIA